MWRAMVACQRQVRATDGGPYAWDLPALLTMADLLGADVAMTAELAPDVEPYVLRAMMGDREE